MKNNTLKANCILFAVMIVAILLLSACGGTLQDKDDFSISGSSTQSGNAEESSLENIGTVSDENQSEAGVAEKTKQKLLGGLSPEEAIEYIKATPNIVILQVNTAQWKIEPGFTGALWIPHDEMETRYDEISEGCPVILHCGAGVVSVPAYETLIKKRPDIPELSYIAGRPHEIMEVYNEWLETN